jgi:hypothetical protein
VYGVGVDAGLPAITAARSSGANDWNSMTTSRWLTSAASEMIW